MTNDETNILEKINFLIIDKLSKLTEGPFRKDVGFFDKMKGNYYPFSAKQVYETLVFRYDFHNKEKPEEFLVELFITLGAYAAYLRSQKHEFSQDLYKSISSDLFNIKIDEIDLSFKDLFLSIDKKYQEYAYDLMSQCAQLIAEYRKKDRYFNKSEMIKMHNAIFQPFISAELIEDFTLVPRDERHLIDFSVTLNHLEHALKVIVEDKYSDRPDNSKMII